MAVDAAAWEAMPADVRAALSNEIEALVADKLQRWDTRDSPDIHVVAATHDAAGMRLHFMIDRYVYRFAQSGSDWAEHDIFVGSARVDGAHIVEPLLAHVLSSNIRESDTDDYRAKDVLAEYRAQLVAELEGIAR